MEEMEDIKEKLANRHHDSHHDPNGTGKKNNKHAIDDIYRIKQKHNGIRPDDWSREKNKVNGNKQNEGDGKEEQDVTTEILKDTRNYSDGYTPAEETNAANTNEELEDAEKESDGGDNNEEQEETTETPKAKNNIPAVETNAADTSEEPKDAEKVNEGGDDNEETTDTLKDDIPADETNAAETSEELKDTEKVNEGELADATISTAYTVLEQDSHDHMSFTQGISYCSDGKIYETTGLYGQSKVRRINPDTFEVEKSIDTPKQFFGEGSTCFVGRDGKEYLIEITWREKKGFIYDVPSLEVIHYFDYTTTAPGNQGWGITYDPKNQEFIVSDGSEYLYFWDVETFEEKRKVAVTRFDGRKQDQINELEFMDGLVCYNIWHQDDIICADTKTGKSVREYGEWSDSYCCIYLLF